MGEREQVIQQLRPMFERARAEKLWFRSGYQGLWFSPNELAELNRQGRFLWGAVNWELLDPLEHLKTLDQAIARAEKEKEDFLKRLKEE